MIMGLHLLNDLDHQIHHAVAIGSESQAHIQALDN
jgi:hypothetical protein